MQKQGQIHDHDDEAEEAKQPIAVPNEEASDSKQEVDPEQVQDDLCLCLYLCLYLFLYLVVEEEEVQPTAVPDVQEDGCIEEEEKPEKDLHSHLANQHELVAMAEEAG